MLQFQNEGYAEAKNVYVLIFVQQCRQLANDVDVNVAMQAPPSESSQIIICGDCRLPRDWPAINIVVSQPLGSVGCGSVLRYRRPIDSLSCRPSNRCATHVTSK